MLLIDHGKGKTMTALKSGMFHWKSLILFQPDFENNMHKVSLQGELHHSPSFPLSSVMAEIGQDFEKNPLIAIGAESGVQKLSKPESCFLKFVRVKGERGRELEGGVENSNTKCSHH